MVPYVGIHEARQVGLQLGVWAVGCRVQDAGCALRLTVVSLTRTAIARLQGGQDTLGYEDLVWGALQADCSPGVIGDCSQGVCCD